MFHLDDVERLLPEKLHGRDAQLVTTSTAMRVTGMRNRHSLPDWATRGVITQVVLPTSKGTLRLKRYVLEEMKLFALVTPDHSHPQWRYLTTFTGDNGISEGKLRKWVQDGVLPTTPSRDPDDPLVLRGELLRLLVNDLYN